MLDRNIATHLDTYFSLLQQYQQKLNVDLSMTYDRGYWWCMNDTTLQKFESIFIQNAENIDEIRGELNVPLLGKKQELLLHLLGWSQQHIQAGEALEEYSICKITGIANASLRALFPKVVTQRYSLKKNTVHSALHSRSLSVKNKILGILAHLSPEITKSLLSKHDIEYIQILAKHRDKARIKVLAEKVRCLIKQ